MGRIEMFRFCAFSRAFFRACLLLAFAFALPAFAADVELESGGGGLTAADDLGGTQVYFGEYDYTGSGSPDPILWYVVETDAVANTATLWTTTNMGDREYDSATHKYWSGSDICAWLNGTAPGEFLGDAFTSVEQAAIETYGTTETGNFETIDISQKVVLPSVAEMGDGDGTGTWGISKGTRSFGTRWWLRSPGERSHQRYTDTRMPWLMLHEPAPVP
jgi:hypothetical protein